MHACKCEYSAGDALVHLPGKLVRLRHAVRAGALYTRRARNHQPSLERKLNKLLKNQGDMLTDLAEMQKNQVEMQKNQVEMQKNQVEMQKNQVEMRKIQAEMQKNLGEFQKNQVEMQKNLIDMQKSIAQLTTDTAVNKALVLVNLTPAASLVLGVLYFVYNNFQASGGG